jgi:hypothetical protein
MRHATITFAIASGMAASLTLDAQAQYQPLPARGISTSFPMGIVFDNSMSTIHRKPPGLPAQMGTFAGTGGNGVPEFRADLIATSLGLAPSALQIDAMSTGNDLLPMVYEVLSSSSSSSYSVQVNSPQGWAVLYFSVASTPGGTTPPVGADIMGLYFGNPAFPSRYRNGLFHELVRADYAGIALPPTAGIAAMDFGMGLIQANGGRKDAGLIEVVDKLYFSLTPSSAAMINSQAFPNSVINGATIFVATFALNVAAVTGVAVHADCNDLQLDLYADIDALGMYTVTDAPMPLVPNHRRLKAGSMCYLLSTENANQELIVRARIEDASANDPWITAPLTSGGQRLPPAFPGSPASPTPRVKGLCTQDPENNNGCAVIGVPAGQLSGATPSMDLSLTAQQWTVDRAYDMFTLTGVLSGWQGAPTAEVVLLCLEYPRGSQSYTYTALPMRSASDTNYTFQVSMQFPWNAQLKTESSFFVGTLSASTPTPAAYSWRSQFNRYLIPPP